MLKCSILAAVLTSLSAATVVQAQAPAVPATAARTAPAAAGPAVPKGVTAASAVEGITEYRLANGLQVLLIPDDSKPTTTVNVTYRVGSRNENYGETGMAHLLEHLLFKGTPTNKNVWASFTQRGLRANGSTGQDRTNYFASFAANDANLRWYLAWQADAMVNSYIARADLDSEMTVVRNEMEMGENEPTRVLYQKTLAAMYQWHNYSHSPIGARTDVENVDIPRLQAFYRQYYQPDNATLIVSGKFDQEKVLGWIADSFGKLPKPKRVLPTLYTLDPVQDGEHSVTVRRVGGVPVLMAGYHLPPAAHRDFAAAEVLSIIMADTPSGRLHKKLADTQMASSVFAFAQGLADPSYVMLGAEVAPGQDVDKTRATMLATLESVHDQPITEDELKRAKTKWLKDWDLSFTNPETVGVSLSESVAQGDWRLFFLTRDRVRDLSLADVQRVAEQFLIDSNRTLGTYLPTEKPVRAPAPARVDVTAELKDFKGDSAAAQVEAFDATPANIEARTQRFKIGNLEAAVLPKGSRGGVVNAVLTVRYGDEKSLFGTDVVSDVVASLLDKGTKTMTRQQIQDRLDELRTEMSVSGGTGSVSIGLSSRRDQLPAAIALVGQLLREPTLPPEALDEYKRQTLSAIEQQRKEPGALIGNAVARLGNPYPRGDVRYVSTFDEQVDDVKAVTVEQLRAFHDRFYGGTKMEFGAAGDLDVAQVRAALQGAFGDWAPKEAFVRVPRPLVEVKGQKLTINTPDKQNATMLTRESIALTDNDPDYPALTVANYLLGGGGNSRLWKRIRETDGLSYDVRSGVSWSNFEPNSGWTASAIFAPQNRPKVEAAFNEVVSQTLKDGFTAQELEDGKRGLLNFRRLARAQDGGLAASLAGNLYLGRTSLVSGKVDDAIAKLKVGDVNAALRKYIKPEDFVSAYGGDFKQ
ncbi:pitrilysin family protein [soil metagenome]